MIPGRINAHAALGFPARNMIQPAATRKPPHSTTAMAANPICRLRRLSLTTHSGLVHSDGGKFPPFRFAEIPEATGQITAA